MDLRSRHAVAHLVTLLALVALVAGAAPVGAYAGAPWFEPSEPYSENFPDPSIALDGTTYYAYGTATGGAYLPVMTSPDAVTWTARSRYPQPACVGGPVDPHFNDALPCPAPWAPDRDVDGRMKKEVWAPGIAEVGGRWLAFYAVRQRLDVDRFCISVATGEGPLGPFVDTTTEPLVCDADPHGSIDPQPFVDTDGSAWLLWKSEGVPGALPTRIWSRALAPEGTSFASGSVATELLRTNQAWEGDVIENPAMVRHQGRLGLFYSGNEHRSAAYATGYAECISMTGPCVKLVDNPVLVSGADRLGPGGPSPFVDLAGDLRVAHHYWNAPHTHYPAHPACRDAGSCTSQGQRRMAIVTMQLPPNPLADGGASPSQPPVQPLEPACAARHVPSARFTDIPSRSPHARAIDCVAWWGLTTGTGPRQYGPAAPVTRGQMATFVARLLGSSTAGLPTGTTRRFPDVPVGARHQDAIAALATAGIVSGLPDGTFEPDGLVSRAQMATFLVRAYERASGQPLTSTRSWFTDAAGSIHQPAIDRATTAGLAGGRIDGTFGPSLPVSRDQMASFLARTLSRLVERGHATARP